MGCSPGGRPQVTPLLRDTQRLAAVVLAWYSREITPAFSRWRFTGRGRGMLAKRRVGGLAVPRRVGHTATHALDSSSGSGGAVGGSGWVGKGRRRLGGAVITQSRNHTPSFRDRVILDLGGRTGRGAGEKQAGGKERGGLLPTKSDVLRDKRPAAAVGWAEPSAVRGWEGATAVGGAVEKSRHKRFSGRGWEGG